MNEEPKSEKVNCSFCGSDMECPEYMLEKSEKHMCFDCFQNNKSKDMPENLSKVHVDIPMGKFTDVVPEAMTNSLVEEAFPEIWNERKEELKNMSKKELAEEMFGAGAYIAINNMFQAMKIEAEGKTKNKKRVPEAGK